ncbi:MAG: hypothetical protein HRU35_03570 [Rickettsiaceae bacterium]|nr:hypothetical protein [Rickettsiaceae bacterium]
MKRVLSLFFITLIIIFIGYLAIKNSPSYWYAKYEHYYEKLETITNGKITSYLPAPIPSPLYYFNLDKIKTKLESPPDWIIKELEQSFAIYKKFTPEEVLKTHELTVPAENYTVFIIKDGKVTYKNRNRNIGRFILRGINYYQKLFSYLHKKKLIGDLVIMIRMSDVMGDEYSEININDIAPLFAFSKNTNKHLDKYSVLIPDWLNLRHWPLNLKQVELANKQFPWDKKLNVVFWRGGMSDVSGYRHGIVNISKNLNQQKIDAQFTEGKLATAKFTKLKDHIAYKYQLSIDGWAATYERSIWQLYSNSVMLKQNSIYTQWFSSALEPGKHYVDVGTNANELLTILSKYSDEELHEIAVAGQKFVKENLMPEDMIVYLILVLQKYEKLQITAQTK